MGDTSPIEFVRLIWEICQMSWTSKGNERYDIYPRPSDDVLHVYHLHVSSGSGNPIFCKIHDELYAWQSEWDMSI